MFIFVAISLVYEENAIHVTYHCFMYNTVFLDFGLKFVKYSITFNLFTSYFNFLFTIHC